MKKWIVPIISILVIILVVIIINLIITNILPKQSEYWNTY